MPNGNLLTVDAYVFQYDVTGTNSEIYNTPIGYLEQRRQHDRPVVGFLSEFRQRIV